MPQFRHSHLTCGLKSLFSTSEAPSNKRIKVKAVRKILSCLFISVLLTGLTPNGATATEPPPTPIKLKLYDRLGKIELDISHANFANFGLSLERKVTGFVLKDKNGTSLLGERAWWDQHYFSNLESNCWQVASLNSFGQGPWSNEVCYALPAPKSKPESLYSNRLTCSLSVVSVRLQEPFYLSSDTATEIMLSDNLGNNYSFAKTITELKVENVDCSISRNYNVAYRNSTGPGPVFELGAFATTQPTSPQNTTPSSSTPSALPPITESVSKLPTDKLLITETPPANRVGALCADQYVVSAIGTGACSKRGGLIAWVVRTGSGLYEIRSSVGSGVGINSTCVGICYGVPSEINGLPRNTYVSGYFRSNGTYVQPYTRSK